MKRDWYWFTPLEDPGGETLRYRFRHPLGQLTIAFPNEATPDFQPWQNLADTLNPVSTRIQEAGRATILGEDR